MRAPILALIVTAAALPALAQTGAAAPSREALALGGRAARGAQPRLEQGVQSLVETVAKTYRDNAAKAGQPVDEKALAEVTKSETDAAKPMLWDSLARIYAETYSADELKALIEVYRTSPGAPPQSLPASLAAKSEDIQRRQRDLVAQVGPRITQDFFGDYCSRASCSDDVRRGAGLPVRAKN